jgi:hypothetical protein
MEMSQRNRIVLAAIALVAALALVTPAPSYAAGLPWTLPAVDRLERAWDWLARFLAGDRSRTQVRQEKEGGMVNPDGTTSHLAPPTPPAIPTPGGGK